MLAELLAVGLVKANVACAVAAVIVVSLRQGIARRWGREAVCRLWRTVPAAGLACIFPGPGLLGDFAFFSHPALSAAEQLAFLFDAVWLTGVLVGLGFLAAGEAAFRRRAALGTAGPAVMGVLWPRVVTPADFALRFTPGQRTLILAHERAHIARGDTRTALIIAVCRVLAWCNPLSAAVARLARLDLELACDADVLWTHPGARRSYGEALLAAQLAPAGASACAWRGAPQIEARLRALRRNWRPRTVAGTLQAPDLTPIAVALLLWIGAPTFLTVSPIDLGGTPSIIFVDLTPR